MSAMLLQKVGDFRIFVINLIVSYMTTSKRNDKNNYITDIDFYNLLYYNTHNNIFMEGADKDGNVYTSVSAVFRKM
ncbi:hypothetical protein GCM10008982_21110 [Anoxybacillus voinovskiensis]|nr:hypothetical protein GCM10008982_21110 [Anoxybacillus voinovskiensis]